MKVAIVYDRVNKWGGAERVLLALHEIFPKSPLYTSVYDAKKAPWAKVFPKVYTSFLQKFPFTRSNHEFLPFLMPLAFASFNLTRFDLVISVTSEAAKGVNIKGKTRHLCYCLTPTRYLWSGYGDYFKWLPLKIIAWPVVGILKIWDKKIAQKPDKIVAISTEVRKRIKKYYGRNSEIIFPPVEIPKIRHFNINKKKNEKHYLLVSRLDYGYKKIDLAIEVFNELGYKLLIIGTGREENKLKKMAGENIVFKGRVSEKELSDCYRNAKALIMPQEEDFGIVAVEAQSFGIPVIAYKKGGVSDTVIPEVTGILFNKQNKKSLKRAVMVFEKKKFDVGKITYNTLRFGKKRFKKEFLDFVKKMLN